MAEYVWKHLPYAIYLDTNALRSAGPNLDAPWINELLSITNEYGVSLCICDLVLAEWCEHVRDVLEGNRQKLLSSMALLKHYDIPLPDITQQKISLPHKTQLTKMVARKLKTAGVEIIRNWDAPLSQLLSEAVTKMPPFDQGGKGLCDAVILESYAEHAKKNFAEPRVLVVSNDGAVKRSEGRFKDRGITVNFMSESDIVGKLKSLLKDEVAAYIESKKSRLKDYVLTYEPKILDFVKRTPLKITDWMLNNPFSKEEDRVYGSLKSILSVRPTRVTDVIGGAPIYGEKAAQNRYPVRIFVEIELDIIITEVDIGIWPQTRTRAIVQPNMIDENTPVPVETGINWKPQEVTKTIRRNCTVLASLDAAKEKNGILDDFRIESVD